MILPSACNATAVMSRSKPALLPPPGLKVVAGSTPPHCARTGEIAKDRNQTALSRWSVIRRSLFIESLFSLLRMHGDHEPTPSPSQEGNGQDADRCLFPSWERLGVGRFMESLLSLLHVHWDHEPWKAPASRTHS